jgi:hypothetical protein
MKKDVLAKDRMISGKLRDKAGRAGAKNTTVTLDGRTYVWSYRHGWVVWGKGIKAMSLSVSLNPGRTRELVLDFTLAVDDAAGAPSEKRVLRTLETGIRQALDAGWDPESRGRAFRFEVAEAV